MRMNAGLFDDARPYGLELFSQRTRVHPRGGTYRQEVFVVVEKEFFGNTAVAQWAANPLFKRLCDNGSPEPFFGGSVISVLKYRLFKHMAPWNVLYSPVFANTCRLRTTGSLKTRRIGEIRSSTRGGTLVVSRKRLGAG